MSLPILFFYIVLFCFCFSFRRFCLCLYHWQMGVCFVYSFIFYSMFELSNVFKEFFFLFSFRFEPAHYNVYSQSYETYFWYEKKKTTFQMNVLDLKSYIWTTALSHTVPLQVPHNCFFFCLSLWKQALNSDPTAN